MGRVITTLKLWTWVLVVGLLMLGVIVLRDVHNVLVHLDDTVKSSNALVVEAQKRVVDTSQNLNANLIHLDIVLGRVERASRNQEQVSRKTLEILAHTDGVLVQTEKTIGHLDSQSMQTLAGLDKAVADADKVLSDPSITESLKNIQASTASSAAALNNAVVATKNVADTTEEIHTLVDTKVKQALKPASIIKQIFLKGLGVAANVATIFK